MCYEHLMIQSQSTVVCMYRCIGDLHIYIQYVNLYGRPQYTDVRYTDVVGYVRTDDAYDVRTDV